MSAACERCSKEQAANDLRIYLSLIVAALLLVYLALRYCVRRSSEMSLNGWLQILFFLRYPGR